MMATWNEYEVQYRDGSTETVIAQRARWRRNPDGPPILMLLPKADYDDRLDAERVTVTARDVPAP